MTIIKFVRKIAVCISRCSSLLPTECLPWTCSTAGNPAKAFLRYRVCIPPLPPPPLFSCDFFFGSALLTKVFKVPSAGIAGGFRNNSANSYIRARVQFIIYKIVPFTKKVIYFSRRRSLLWTSREQIISSCFDVHKGHCLFASWDPFLAILSIIYTYNY